MDIIDKRIDNGKAFDFGKTSSDYSKYRDIYPQFFYDKIISRNLCILGQKVHRNWNGRYSKKYVSIRRNLLTFC